MAFTTYSPRFVGAVEEHWGTPVNWAWQYCSARPETEGETVAGRGWGLLSSGVLSEGAEMMAVAACTVVEAETGVAPA